MSVICIVMVAVLVLRSEESEALSFTVTFKIYVGSLSLSKCPVAVNIPYKNIKNILLDAINDNQS